MDVMEPTSRPLSDRRPQDAPRFSAAGVLLEGLAVQDFDRLSTALSDDVEMVALLPRGLREWQGVADVRDRFGVWFGDTEEYELVDASVGQVVTRLHLCWRVRLRADRLGRGWHVVEQQVFADCGPDGRISRISLLCSGYRSETGDD